MVLILSLLYANYVMYDYITQLRIVRDKYQQCIMHLTRVEVQNSSMPDEQVLNQSLIVLNRAPSYLKDSTVDYFKNQSLDTVLDAIDFDDWSEYAQTIGQHTLTLPIAPKRKITSSNKKKVFQRQPNAAKKGLFQWPIAPGSFWLSSGFGPRAKKNGTMGFHMGIDMAAPKGTIVRAAAAGKIIEVKHYVQGQAKGYGNTVVIQHAKGYKTRYAHLDVMYAHEGQFVDMHKVIGKVGETGYIRKRGRDGSHLHFEIYDKGKRVNPLMYLPSYSL